MTASCLGERVLVINLGDGPSILMETVAVPRNNRNSSDERGWE